MILSVSSGASGRLVLNLPSPCNLYQINSTKNDILKLIEIKWSVCCFFRDIITLFCKNTYEMDQYERTCNHEHCNILKFHPLPQRGFSPEAAVKIFKKHIISGEVMLYLVWKIWERTTFDKVRHLPTCFTNFSHHLQKDVNWWHH